MPGPGEYVGDETEGVVDPKDLPQPIVDIARCRGSPGASAGHPGDVFQAPLRAVRDLLQR